MSWFPPPRTRRTAEVRIEHLNGIALEWAIACHEGYTSLGDYTNLMPRLRVQEVLEPNNDVWWLTIYRNPTYPVTEDWEPLTNWLQLGKLIDKYQLTYQATTRDHPENRFRAFCPDIVAEGVGTPGYGLGPDIKTAMLRSILLCGGQEIFEVPRDLALRAKCAIEKDWNYDDEPEDQHDPDVRSDSEF